MTNYPPEFPVLAARDALDKGVPVHVAALHESFRHVWGQVIADIEAMGWTLEHWAVTTAGDDTFAYPVFRRTSPPRP
ncbi:hypothetical protein ACFPZ0_03790 [Streptomonospora nanhaiensis]|uniref:Uncharacterized protein n=1 Tax=Streptomonospora nanhaiensis TaxID=1323731 RepID=A0A853BNH5_9ACTN|nr:hypothetical protein [Streptomonospora nanhaiensis]MBV2361982.1 hypothetical protein [Streptomonospora nanhaiensis]MBX9386785.1 hypothetical protein [Streptomonospora nanhaiensis]NYI96197.1 hypothetical protein [Streptomonospora nanhaiensis]